MSSYACGSRRVKKSINRLSPEPVALPPSKRRGRKHNAHRTENVVSPSLPSRNHPIAKKKKKYCSRSLRQASPLIRSKNIPAVTNTNPNAPKLPPSSCGQPELSLVKKDGKASSNEAATVSVVQPELILKNPPSSMVSIPRTEVVIMKASKKNRKTDNDETCRAARVRPFSSEYFTPNVPKKQPRLVLKYKELVRGSSSDPIKLDSDSENSEDKMLGSTSANDVSQHLAPQSQRKYTVRILHPRALPPERITQPDYMGDREMACGHDDDDDKLRLAQIKEPSLMPPLTWPIEHDFDQDLGGSYSCDMMMSPKHNNSPPLLSPHYTNIGYFSSPEKANKTTDYYGLNSDPPESILFNNIADSSHMFNSDNIGQETGLEFSLSQELNDILEPPPEYDPDLDWIFEEFPATKNWSSM